MNHIPNWQVWEGGAGHIWVGYTDEKSGFQAPRIEVIWKGKFPNADEAKALGQKTVSALNSYPALVAALQEIAKGKGPYSRDRLTHAANTIDAMKQIAVDALAAAGESEPRAASDPPDSTTQEA